MQADSEGQFNWTYSSTHTNANTMDPVITDSSSEVGSSTLHRPSILDLPNPPTGHFSALTPEELPVKHPSYYSDTPVEEYPKNIAGNLAEDTNPYLDHYRPVRLNPCVDYNGSHVHSCAPGNFDYFSEYQRVSVGYEHSSSNHSTFKKNPSARKITSERINTLKNTSSSVTPLVRTTSEEDTKVSMKVCMVAVILLLLAMVIPAGMAAVGILFSCDDEPKISILLFVGSGISFAIIMTVAFTVVFLKKKFLAGVVLTISSCIIIAWYAAACVFVYEMYPLKNSENCDKVVLTFIFWMLNAFWLVFSPLFISTCFFMYSAVKEKLKKKELGEVTSS